MTRINYLVLWVSGLFIAANLSWAQAPGAEDGVEELARGPVHEAFAEPLVLDPASIPVIAKRPPEPVEELPPEEKPAGENVAWLPGYWSWDDDRSDFLWVSGFWRALPPGREWVPGYWQPAEGGWRWVAGYWAKAEEAEMEFLPAPPKSLEAGPSLARPTEDHLWIPGCWTWTNRIGCGCQPIMCGRPVVMCLWRATGIIRW
jgi:WXXGXW repeat (2 copies)